MCCRYWAEESFELREIVEEMSRSPLMGRWQTTTGIKCYGEMRPTDVVPVIASDRSCRRAVFPMKWGFSAGTLLINARVETAASKPTFKEAWERRRCIIPASWYYEWEHETGSDGRRRTGAKYMIQPEGASMTWMCGLYRIEQGLPVFVVLTRESDSAIRFIHDRMPLILPKEHIEDWIRPNVNPSNLVGEALTDMVFEKAV